MSGDEAAPWAEAIAGPAPAAVRWLTAVDGARLRAALWRPEGGAVRGLAHLLPGRTEYLEKYDAFARRLTARGFAVAGIDWRGQGLSSRDPKAARLGHVGGFAEYRRDLDALLGWPEAAAVAGPRVAVAHSMGGCIALRGLTEGRLAPDGIVFSAPMWGLAQPRALLAAAGGLARAARAFGRSHRAAPGQGADRPYVLSAAFEDNVLVADPGVWARLRREAEARPDLTLHAPTLGWLAAALAEMAALRRAPPSGVPALILLGGREAVVSAAAIRARAAADPDARLVELPEARHEPLMEPPGTPLGDAVEAALAPFLDAVAAG